MQILLVRHTSVNVPAGTCYGQTDVPLNPTFETEAAFTRANLQVLLSDGLPVDKVFTSPLSRCTRLATYCGYPDAERDPRLLEINFGEWEMQPFDTISDPRLQEWYADYLHVPATGGESFAQQYRRVASFLDELRNTYNHPNDNATPHRILIFAHGGVLLCAQIYAGLLTPDEAFGALTPYGGIVRIILSTKK